MRDARIRVTPRHATHIRIIQDELEATMVHHRDTHRGLEAIGELDDGAQYSVEDVVVECIIAIRQLPLSDLEGMSAWLSDCPHASFSRSFLSSIVKEEIQFRREQGRGSSMSGGR